MVIKNFKKVKITGNKIEQEKDFHYSGYMGGLKEHTWKTAMEKNPAKILENAVYRMLPTNKLRDRMIKRLSVEL